MDFDPSAGISNLSPVGGWDIFIAKYDTTCLPVIASVSNDDTICIGDSVSLSASGGGIYLWTPLSGLSNPAIANPFASPSVTTTYSVIVSSGCASDTVYVTLMVNPTSVVNDSISITQGDSALIHGNYETVAGIYYDTLVAANGCDSILATTLTVIIGINEYTNSSFSIHPNPTTGLFTVKGTTSKLEVYDLFGRPVLETTGEEIDMSGFPSGIYFVKAGEAVRKLVKQ